ncbi:facilitated trehalose transporter Tret1-2 homolog isoform X2 [Apis mellifera]|nr:facilitated trehalose transporter Tret1-2 homolog isoform X2 [Apis mellifera]XP_026300829.1 facilitated trehalose transporter Tret1-2 homolog isoform X2 [Apis mellifera]|eukprot:XP_006562375.2 facilitated trehalose transporter Tret1-2 homolog isoform X2 [Apis mellifera]
MTETMDVLIDTGKEVSDMGDVISTYITSPEKKRNKTKTQWRQWLACISATLSMVAVGTVYGWVTTSLSRLTSENSGMPFKITNDEGSWIVSLTVIGSMTGPFLGACLADRFGPKRCLLISSGFFIVGWLLVLLANTVSVLYVARVILGIGVGISYTTNPMYVSEVADINIRGALGTLIAVNVFTGSLMTCSIGPWVSYKILATILLVIPVLFIASFIWFPESPHFLAVRGRKTEASQSIAFFKGIRDPNEVKKELSLILRGLSRNDSFQSNTSQNIEIITYTWLAKLRFLLLPNNMKALCIVVSLIAAQQLSGNFSTIQYLDVLFRKAAISIDSNVATIIVLAVGLISGSLATITVEVAGRRSLLMISTFGSFLTLAILAIYFMLDIKSIDVSMINFLPVIDVIFFQIAFQIGLGVLPNALIGELFPTEVKSVAGAIVTIFDGILGFIVSKLYQVIGDSFGSHTVYYFFSASCLLAFFNVMVFVPETKGKTYREIQALLAGKELNSSNERVKNDDNDVI